MAKYLGGTDSQQEEVKAELITPGLLNTVSRKRLRLN